jgi:hypothetical protein
MLRLSRSLLYRFSHYLIAGSTSAVCICIVLGCVGFAFNVRITTMEDIHAMFILLCALSVLLFGFLVVSRYVEVRLIAILEAVC